jgi:hypothetical protein
LHTYWVANLRHVLDVVVSPGKEHSAGKTRPGLMHVMGQLCPEHRPKLVRGDCGFGNETFIAELEQANQPYLFKLKQSVGVKKLVTRQFAREDWSTPGPPDQGWSAVEDTLKLSDWTQARRVIVLRRAVKSDLAMSRKAKTSSDLSQLGEQIELLMPAQDVQAWEFVVLVTNSATLWQLSASSNKLPDQEWKKVVLHGATPPLTSRSRLHNPGCCTVQHPSPEA